MTFKDHDALRIRVELNNRACLIIKYEINIAVNILLLLGMVGNKILLGFISTNSAENARAVLARHLFSFCCHCSSVRCASLFRCCPFSLCCMLTNALSVCLRVCCGTFETPKTHTPRDQHSPTPSFSSSVGVHMISGSRAKHESSAPITASIQQGFREHTPRSKRNMTNQSAFSLLFPRFPVSRGIPKPPKDQRSSIARQTSLYLFIYLLTCLFVCLFI